MKIFITGIAGLIGSNLATRLRQYEHHVIGCDTFIGGYKDNVPAYIVHNEDIHNTAKLTTILEEFKPDVVVHCAAFAYEGLSVFSPSLVVNNIVSGTLSVATAAVQAKVRRFINCSSMARYGQGIPPFTEDMMPNPVDPYGLGKVQAEQQLKLLSDIHGLEVITVVPHNVIGIGQRYTDPYRNVAAIMCNQAINNKPIYIYGDGKQQRSFSDVRDCVKALITLLSCSDNLNGKIYNIGPDENEVTILELAQLVKRLNGSKSTIIHLPDRPREVKNAFCSSELIKRDFNYQITYNLEQTIGDLSEWMQNRKQFKFEYHLPLEITSSIDIPRTWTDKLF